MSDKPVKIRFIIQDISPKEWLELPPFGYYPIIRKKTVQGYKLGGKVLVKIADEGNWKDDILLEKGEFDCKRCEDAGVLHLEQGWTSCQDCSLGQYIRKYYKKGASTPTIE